ncbi:FHA domain-containing protein FhaB/FipA [Luteimicrobium subarcticum]|uniref:Type III secretion system (T3SS) inner membrane Yop/YscD-like protein n=1 Tax=Luteimicrobium subarcticum TaxID=620910 RepID=A0A2M8WJH6_9MICO|nr:FHA domain-containing protein [Luteimicrobium subarcticum]PJI91048.1 type III secretion system (T3SS) inner membrane Yop/YscD-like protein [Luteimicrobium subarcticum]
MSELTFTLLRLGYLVVLWLLVLSAIRVLRRDLAEPAPTPEPAPQQPRAELRPSSGPVQVPQYHHATPTGTPAQGVQSAPVSAPTPAAAQTVGNLPRTPVLPGTTDSRTAARHQPRVSTTRLVVVEGSLRGTSLPLSGSGVLLGRAPSCTLVLDDDYSSARHARVFPQHGSWFVEDLGSTNGTYLDGNRLVAPVEVRPGSQIRIGQTVMELQR